MQRTRCSPTYGGSAIDRDRTTSSATPGTRSDQGDGTSASAPHLAELLSRAATGDHQAFAELYDATAPRVFGLALRVLEDRAQAEAVTVETYLHIWRECARFDASRNGAIPWMLTIAHGNATRRARQRLPGTRPMPKRLSDSIRGPRARARETKTVQPSCEAERVHRTLRRLTPIQRESLELTYLGGHTRSEVAALTGTSEEATSSAIRDGLVGLLDGEK